MRKKGLTILLSAFVICFYMAIMMYVFFAVLHIYALENFVSACLFEMIGFGLLIYFVIGSLGSRAIKIGFCVPLSLVTIAYTVLLNIINIFCVISMPPVFFVLVHLLLLFVYCVISIPMCTMGRR